MTRALPLANRFLLEGHGLDIEIAPSVEGGTLLRYHSGTTHTDFAKEAVVVEESIIGTRYTVTLADTPDVGSTLFSVLVPRVHAPFTGDTPVRTVSVTTVIKTGLFPGVAPGQDQTYTAHDLQGTGSYVSS